MACIYTSKRALARFCKKRPALFMPKVYSGKSSSRPRTFTGKGQSEANNTSLAVPAGAFPASQWGLQILGNTPQRHPALAFA
ncbi:hypothetical protein VTL71DRAFT_4800, partial [Oculimacula yallundae]